MIDYKSFLASKYVVAKPTGFAVAPEAVNPHLFAFQRDIVRRACHLGKSAIFSRVGTGKTRMQLAFADLVTKHTGGRAIILAPLAVAPQTVAEGAKIGSALKLGRIGEAVELKPSYHKIAVKHLKAAEVANGQLRLELAI